MSEYKPTIRERIASLPKGAKIAGGVVGAAAIVGLGFKLFGGSKEEEHQEPQEHGAHHGHGHADGHGHGHQKKPETRPEARPQQAPSPPAHVVEAVPVRMQPTHPLSTLLVPTVNHIGRQRFVPPRVIIGMPADLAIRQDVERLLADVARAKRGEPILGAAPSSAKTQEAELARVSFELGAYVAEALMARGIVAQMPDVPRTSAIGPNMTEKDGDEAFQALVDSTEGPLDSAGLSALQNLKSCSGVTFWADPGTAAKVREDVSRIKAARA